MSSGDESDNSGSDLSSSSEYSLQDDDVLEELFDSDGEEEHFAGFNFNLPENMKWENQHFDVDMQPFMLTPGPTINLPDAGKAFDFFSLLKAFIAMLIISNDIIVVPRDERYFLSSSEARLFHIPGVKNILRSRKRFFQLKIVHILLRPRPQTNRRRKARPLI